MFDLIFSLLFLAQPALPYEMLGSPKYHERERATLYLSRKGYIDENKLFALSKKSPDEEVRKNASIILRERYEILDEREYPAICFMALSINENNICYPNHSIGTDGPVARLVKNYLETEYSKALELSGYFSLNEQRRLCQRFIFDMRTKKGINRKVLDLWIAAAREYERQFLNDHPYHENYS